MVVQPACFADTLEKKSRSRARLTLVAPSARISIEVDFYGSSLPSRQMTLTTVTLGDLPDATNYASESWMRNRS